MRIKKLRYIRGDLYSYISILLMWFAAFASLYSDSANKVGLYVALPTAFVLCTLKNKGFHFNIYEKILYALFLWDCVAYLWADNKELASTELHMLLGAFLLTYVVSIVAREEKYIPFLYIVWLLLYLSAWNYAFHHILAFMVSDTDRLNDENLNANTLAYYTFFVSFLSFVLAEIAKNKKVRLGWLALFWIMLPVSFATSILTASRQVIVIQLPLYALLIYQKYIKGASAKHKLAFASVLLICLIAVSGQVADIYDNSFLKQRSEKSLADDTRLQVAENAISIGFANFPLGVGSNNLQSMSDRREIAHNSYLEAFADMGIPGFVLYTSLVFVFTLRQWKRYRASDDKMYFSFFTFGLIFILYGFFFVFYNGVWLISYFMLVAAHSETYYQKALDENIAYPSSDAQRRD